MSGPVHATRSGHAEWLRLVAFAAVLLACVLVPFALWGDALDRAAPQWLDAQDARLWIAAFGIALLMADVLLPVPSSVVAMGLCWSLGPVWGGSAVAIGGLMAFATGYGIGRLVPEDRLRRWVGPMVWDRAREQAWIVFARPLPVLAEMSALLAGVWRLPPGAAFASAASSSCMVGALYAAFAWLGWQAPGIVPALIAMSALPTMMWIAHRYALRGLLRTD